ncbi:MAG: ABC transporter permease, partial [Nocardioides sp.]|nr:ABC transporter permease [Nocardioides sp.]
AVTAQAALAEGVAPADLEQLVEQATTGGPAYDLTRGEASNEQLDAGASLVAGQAGLFMLFTVSFGVTSLLLERDTGTLARLRSMPIPGWVIVASKALVSVVLGVVATGILLTLGSVLFDADFGSVPAVALLVLCAVTAGTSVMFLIVRVARTAEQAGVATSIVALVLGIAGGAFFPISSAGSASVLLDLNPVAAMLRGLGTTSGGGGLADIGVPVAIMLGFAAVMVTASRLVPDRGALA